MEQVSEQLMLVGLREYSFDAPKDGGFRVLETDGLVSVEWSTTEAYAQPSYKQLGIGNIGHPHVTRHGKVLQIMARAMLEILLAAGFVARLSANEYTPAAVEVIGSPADG